MKSHNQTPVQSPPSRPLPYGRQSIGEDDIQAVVEVLRSDWLTTGPAVDRFEKGIAEFVGAEHAVAVSSGTAALHAAMYAAGVGPGDEVIVPAMTFAATANAAVFLGAIPVFADIEPDTLLVDPASVEKRLTSRTKAIAAVDYAGQPCDYASLTRIAAESNAVLIADGCHALGAALAGKRVGSLAGLTAFSFHPVKHITTGEGGMITTNDPELAQRMRLFRNHGISSDHRERSERGSWFYEMVDLGYNYRISDFQCALGLSQLKKLPEWVRRRQQIAARYDEGFLGSAITPLTRRAGATHAFHLYVVRVNGDRQAAFSRLRERGIGANVHYIPVHLHPYYQRRFGTCPGLCPVAEEAYRQILSLPMFPAMTDEDADFVIESLRDVVS
ncbi:MAG: UDP-4-amino-4,6-dideoxy-N-acetyl-beta-L-altrosamine transaminase [Bryobacteraceae bacterium]